MKKSQLLTLICLVLALLSTPGVNATVSESSGKPTIAVFINDHMVNAAKDSLEITAKGTLRLAGIANQYEQLGLVKFRIQIKRATSAGTWQLSPFIEEYMGGKHFSTLKLEDLLSNVKQGDQVVLIPVEDSSKYENGGKPILLHVIGDRC